MRNEKSLRKTLSLAGISAWLCVTVLSPWPARGEDFFSRHWERPLKSQSGWEISSLQPKACGECHKTQLADWSGSLHSKSAGPGLLIQISPHDDPAFARSCLYCHAPLAEQSEIVEDAGGESENPRFDRDLLRSGVGCAVCHLREGRVYGPPRAEGTIAGKAHDGFIAREEFGKAEFCAACHQLDGGYELNGKLLTNTYAEWQESAYGKNGAACQDCHMPDRRHLWRGIHDPDMTRSAVDIRVERRDDGAKLVITNSGAGHYFPTYVTPLIVIKGYLRSADGETVPSSVKTGFIGRKVNLELSEELFDTRIRPEESFEFDYPVSNPADGERIKFEVWVYPDNYYHELFKAMLEGKSDEARVDEIKNLIKTTGESAYLLWESGKARILRPRME